MSKEDSTEKSALAYNPLHDSVLSSILIEVNEETIKAIVRFPDFASEHEGYAVLKEEVDELWDAVKLNQSNGARMTMIRREAIQVAAMAIRLIYNRCDRVKI